MKVYFQYELEALMATKCNKIFFPGQKYQFYIALTLMDDLVEDFMAVVMSLWFCPNKIPVSKLMKLTKA